MNRIPGPSRTLEGGLSYSANVSSPMGGVTLGSADFEMLHVSSRHDSVGKRSSSHKELLGQEGILCCTKARCIREKCRRSLPMMGEMLQVKVNKGPLALCGGWPEGCC